MKQFLIPLSFLSFLFLLTNCDDSSSNPVPVELQKSIFEVKKTDIVEASKYITLANPYENNSSARIAQINEVENSY